MERIEKDKPQGNNARLIIGIVFLTLGALLFADRFNIIPFAWNRYLFTWQSLLIFLGLISLSKKESRATGIVLIAIGGFFLTAKIFHYPFGIRYFFWPIAFVGVGLLLILHRSGSGHHSKIGTTRGVVDIDFVDDVAIFGGSEQKVTSKNFRGGKISNIFGGSTFDMMDAELAPGQNVLDVFSLFGSTKIIVPTGWRVKIEITSIFGGYNDKRRVSPTLTTDNSRELVLRGVVIFGGGEIKGY